MDFLFSHPTQNSLVINVVNEKRRQHHFRITPFDKDWRRLDLFGHKAYSSSTLQFRIAKYEALLSKYNHVNYSKLNKFNQHIPQDKKEQFQALVTEGRLLAYRALQVSFDTGDTVA